MPVLPTLWPQCHHPISLHAPQYLLLSKINEPDRRLYFPKLRQKKKNTLFFHHESFSFRHFPMAMKNGLLHYLILQEENV